MNARLSEHVARIEREAAQSAAALREHAQQAAADSERAAAAEAEVTRLQAELEAHEKQIALLEVCVLLSCLSVRTTAHRAKTQLHMA